MEVDKWSTPKIQLSMVLLEWNVFVGKLIVLYAITQGLNIISSAPMGVCANALGGIHLHEFFKLPTRDNVSILPYHSAQLALEKIMRKTSLLHALLTLDVIFLTKLAKSHLANYQ